MRLFKTTDERSNVYQINIFEVFKFMRKAKNNSKPRIFDEMFKTVNHNFSTRFSTNSFK